jgi:hypothetical protein
MRPAVLLFLIGSTLSVAATVPLSRAAAQANVTISFDDLTSPNRVLSGQYPSGVIEWGINSWYLSGPFGLFRTNSIGFNGPGPTSASFTLLTPRRVVQIDAYNGGSTSSLIQLDCAGLPAAQVQLGARELTTITTGWSDVCATVLVSSSNGWNTNFDNLVVGDPLAAPTQTVTPAPTLTPPPGSCPCTIFDSGTVPSSTGSGNPVELGVKFRSDVAGTISGIRFYKQSTEAGTHAVSLWNTSGTLLASDSSTSETGSGWQQVDFGAPVTIAANTTYVASYYSNGRFSYTSGAFASTGVDNLPLHALMNGVDGANGVYMYGASSSFPTNGFQSSNYFVDVVFGPTAQPTDTPTPTPTSTPTPAPTLTSTTTVTPSATPSAMVTPTPSPQPTVVVNFDDLPAPNRAFSAQYPSGVIDWGTNNWYLAGPFGLFTTNSIGFNGPLLRNADFTFLSPRRLVQVDAYNGGTVTSIIQLGCAGLPVVQVALGARQLTTIVTGWTDACGSVGVASSNGWDTNFDNLVYVDQPQTVTPTATQTPMSTATPTQTSTPTQTPTQTTTPTITPTPTQSATTPPTLTPTPTQTATATPTQTPTQTTTPTPAQTPTQTPTPSPTQIGSNHQIAVGPGFSDVSPHQLVRTQGNVLYMVVPTCDSYPSCPANSLRVYRADQAGLPSSFSEQDVAHRPSGGVGSSSIGIDGAGLIHVLWNDRQGTGHANYAAFDTASNRWRPTTTLQVTGWTTFGQGDEGVALAVDATGAPHAAWNAIGVDGALHVQYATMVGGTWTSPQQVDDIALANNHSAWHPTLAFTAGGDLILAWLDGTFNQTPDGTIHVRVRQANGLWAASQAIPDQALTSIDNGPSLLLTADGVQHLTFLNGSDEVRYWYNAGAGWRGDQQPPLQVTHDPSLGPDGAGGVFIYGHGSPPPGDPTGHGDNLYRFHKSPGGSWSAFTLYTVGSFDSSVSTRWSQFFHAFQDVLDVIYWSDAYPNELFAGVN